MAHTTPPDSLWRASLGPAFSPPALAGDLTADLVVIGGGFTGCAAALEAARTGASAVLLEAKDIGIGGSGRNAGLVNAGLWLPPDTVLDHLGDSAGQRLIDMLGKGPEKVFDLIARENIDCEATRAGTLHLAHSESGMRDLSDRHRQGNRHGAPLQLLDGADTARRTGTNRFQGALFDPRAGTVQPLAYCTGLARAAARAGARLHTRSPVTGLRRSHDQWEVVANGNTVTAKALLMATNAYHRGFPGAPEPRFSVVHYSQFATDPLAPADRERILPGGEGCWDTAPVMSSFRLDRAGRLIVGGMGKAEGAGARVHTAWARRKLRQVFPDLGDIGFSHIWHGRIAMTADHIPKVLQPGPDSLAIFGYSGRGIAPGTVFGTAAARALLNGDADALPIAPSTGYSEHFTGARTALFELAATLAHAVAR
ncbi:MAG: NAD(P)/FAD-dependent oxidoreductase [Marinibacterium sp.]